jgi:hypothetical protein
MITSSLAHFMRNILYTVTHKMLFQTPSHSSKQVVTKIKLNLIMY